MNKTFLTLMLGALSETKTIVTTSNISGGMGGGWNQGIRPGGR